MGERKKEKEAALSLNDRHNRRLLLQDLSSAAHPPPPPHSSSLPPPPPPPPPPLAGGEVNVSKVKIQGRRRLCKTTSSSAIDYDYEDGIPLFSGIADFDSPPPPPPPPVETKPSKVELERTSLFPRYTDDMDNPQMLQDSKFPTTTDSRHHHQHPPVDKPSKVKIEGRRRLCKVSSKDADSTDSDCKKTTVDDDPKLSRVSEFDITPPPPQAKNALESGNAGGNEIRDILNDLTSRLDFLSIQKNRIPKTVDSERDPSVIVANDIYKQPKKEDMPEYASASSSSLFFDTSDPSDSSFNATNQSMIGGGVEIKVDGPEEENYLQSESKGDNCSSTVNKIKNTSKEHKMIKSKREAGNENSVSLGQPLASKFEGREEEDDDDDCVLLSGKKMIKEVERQRGKFEEFDDCYEVDALDEYTVSEDDNSITLSSGKATYRLPGKIGKMLYPHQRDGLKWLWSLHCQGKGGILGDDMGLGKTMQICGFLAGLFDSSLIKRALIVAPKTLLPHWIKELAAVGLSAKIREYFGTCAKARQYELQYILQDKGVLLTTYDIVRNNAKSLCGDYNGERSEDGNTWDYMILDEGHLIKNPGTQRAKSLLEIPCTHRIVISGTPIQNNLKELWALFNFCCPELLGDKNSFKEKYESAIIRGSDKNASDREKRIGSTVAKELRERIQPCFLRRLKSEVFREDDATITAKLSKKNEFIVWLSLTNCQRQLYEAFLNSELVLSAFDGSPLAALTILKKICDHPLLLTKRAAEDLLEGMDSMLNQEDHGVAEKLAKHIADVSERYDFKEKHDDVSCKISFIQSLLDKLLSEGHNVLIFSQTRKMLNLIQDSLISRGYEFLRIDGTTKASDRVKVVNDFQEGVAPIFLLTSQVGGLGLTLTKADRVIVVDPAWNPSTDNQSVDRAYRIGQKKDVIVYRLMTCGTIEEKIYRKQIFKGGLFKTATEHKEQTRYFSQQDLRELFSLPKQGFDVSPTQQQLHEEHDHQHTMDETLQAHIKFLETLGIAGVSNHSLLFSKTAPVPVVREEEEVERVKGSVTFMGQTSSISSVENNGDGVEFAFNPKDVKLNWKSSSLATSGKPTEREIKERINRLSQIFANKATVTKLPDKGARIQKQIVDLNLELNRIRVAKIADKEVIHI